VGENFGAMDGKARPGRIWGEGHRNLGEFAEKE